MWDKHINTIAYTRLAKIVCDTRPADKRCPEKPRKRWKESLE